MVQMLLFLSFVFSKIPLVVLGETLSEAGEMNKARL
jgi:hypothetical protein